MLIEIYGGSDDIIGYRVDGGRENGGKHDEIGAYNSGGLWMRSLTVTTIGGSQGVRIHAVYDGCWSFAVGLLEEGRGLPNWTFRLDREHEYSTRLLILADEPLVVTAEERP